MMWVKLKETAQLSLAYRWYILYKHIIVCVYMTGKQKLNWLGQWRGLKGSLRGQYWGKIYIVYVNVFSETQYHIQWIQTKTTKPTECQAKRVNGMRQETRWTPLQLHHWITDWMREFPSYELGGKEHLPERRQRSCESEGHQQITTKRIRHQRVLEACQGPWRTSHFRWIYTGTWECPRVRDLTLRSHTSQFLCLPFSVHTS